MFQQIRFFDTVYFVKQDEILLLITVSISYLESVEV